ncbi:MAG: hypothetical protein JST84_30430 [Acidobacteria bacterium]|nr:hypothetical protein [Acidobacteriota bacterium]
MGEKELKGIIQKTAQGCDSYEIFDADAEFLTRLVKVLTSHFGMISASEPILGNDVVYWDFERDGTKLTAGWDIWSGCFVFGYNTAGNELVREIAQYLDQVLHEL